MSAHTPPDWVEAAGLTFTIVSDDGVEFPCNQAVLAADCHFIRDLLLHQPDTKVINVPFSSSEVGVFLEWYYSRDDDNLDELLGSNMYKYMSIDVGPWSYTIMNDRLKKCAVCKVLDFKGATVCDIHKCGRCGSWACRKCWRYNLFAEKICVLCCRASG